MKREVYRDHGTFIVEAAAALVLLFPLIMVVLFVVLEGSYAYLIKYSLSQAARQAARDLAIAYGDNPEIASDRGLQDRTVFDKIRLNNMVNSSKQFDNPDFQTNSDPPTVAVRVRYAGGQFGLPPFPNPDPLKLSSTFGIDGTSAYRLE